MRGAFRAVAQNHRQLVLVEKHSSQRIVFFATDRIPTLVLGERNLRVGNFIEPWADKNLRLSFGVIDSVGASALEGALLDFLSVA